MSAANFVAAGIQAITRSGAGPWSTFELVVSCLLVAAMVVASLRPDRTPVDRLSSSWPPPEGTYWGM